MHPSLLSETKIHEQNPSYPHIIAMAPRDASSSKGKGKEVTKKRKGGGDTTVQQAKRAKASKSALSRLPPVTIEDVEDEGEDTEKASKSQESDHESSEAELGKQMKVVCVYIR
jgi:hypothetical protein